MGDVTVAPCTREAAEYAVLHWHYSEKMPAGKLITFGVWEAGKFIGAVIFGRGANHNMGGPYGLTQAQVAELVRVALRDHAAPVSQIVAAALRQLHASNPGLRLVVSYADPQEGHHGGIYQAGNWIYAGDSTPTPAFFDTAGRKWHSRQVSTDGYSRQFGALKKMPKRRDLRQVMMPGKHRYLMPLDRGMRRQVEKLRRDDTPKRKRDDT